jgi:hypothetical protein
VADLSGRRCFAVGDSGAGALTCGAALTAVGWLHIIGSRELLELLKIGKQRIREILQRRSRQLGGLIGVGKSSYTVPI